MRRHHFFIVLFENFRNAKVMTHHDENKKNLHMQRSEKICNSCQNVKHDVLFCHYHFIIAIDFEVTT